MLTLTIVKYPVRTSQRTRPTIITVGKELRLFGQILAVYCEKHMQHMNTLCGQNGTYSYHCGLEDHPMTDIGDVTPCHAGHLTDDS